MTAPTTTPTRAKAQPTTPLRSTINHPALVPPPDEAEADAAELPPALDAPPVGDAAGVPAAEGVNTPPAGTLARHDVAASDAAWADLGADEETVPLPEKSHAWTLKSWAT